MSTNKKPSGSIHRIREFELEKVNLADEFDILQIVGEGWFGKILLVEHRATDTEMVLKALPKPYVSLRDFYREFHYGLHLGVHKNIVTTYDVAFETAGFYVFTQEYAPLGDLTSNVLETGIGEIHSKKVAKQIGAALDYMHSKDIVHRDVKLDNVLVCRSDFSRVKLCDFGESRKTDSYVQRRNEWLPYSPPEVLCVKTDDTYKALPIHDVWQFGIVIFVCLTGCLPWQKAQSDDTRYIRYLAWHGSSMVIPIKRTPKLFKLLTSKCCKMFRKFLEPNKERRPKNLNDLHKYLDDRWLTKGAEKDMLVSDTDELCPSMYSFHSSPEEKNKLLSTLAQHGIETTVDRVAKKNRIRDWIQSSVIMEEDEDDNSGSTTPSSIRRAPIAGHISAVRAMEENAKKKVITSTIKDASNRHIDPRTGLYQEGPSEMLKMSSHNINNNNNNNNNNNHNDDNEYEEIKINNQNYNNREINKTIRNITKNNNKTYINNSNNNINNIEIKNGHIKFNRLVDVGSQTSTDSNKESSPITTIGTSTEPLTYSELEKNNSSININYKNNNNNQSKSIKNTNHKTSSTATTITDIIRNDLVNGGSIRSRPTIMDSGYSSMDKLKNIDTSNKLFNKINSPVLLKRSTIKSSQSDYITIDNELLDNHHEILDDSDNSQRGSSGFVHLVGLDKEMSPTSSSVTSSNNTTMKDTAYDQIKPKRKLTKKLI